MNITDTAVSALKELSDSIKSVNEEHVKTLMHEILNAKKIYVTGAGRSLLMLRGFAMRLMHIGLEVYVVGDTTTPAFEADDLLIVGSGSGETRGAVNTATRAKAIGGRVALITIREDSTLAKMSDCVITIPAYTDKVKDDSMKRPILPGGTMFEQAMLVLSDTMILPLAEEVGIRTDRAFSRHANLE